MAISFSFDKDSEGKWIDCSGSTGGKIISILETGLMELAKRSPEKRDAYEKIIEFLRLFSILVPVYEIDASLWPDMREAFEIGIVLNPLKLPSEIADQVLAFLESPPDQQ